MLHEPVPMDTAEKLGNPRCAFVTGGPREYLAGLNCMGRRLEALGSKHPLLIMVEPEDEVYMRRHLVVNSHPSSAVLAWARFPEKVNRTTSWRYRGAHVMDKMNLFGMPFRRLVWIDADVFIRRSVDELCELPEDIEFATTLDAEGKPTQCWPKRGKCASSCQNEYDLARDAVPYVAQRVQELRPSPAACPYIIQTGVMMLQPFNLTAFNALIVDPIRAGAVATYDSGDQGILSTMLYGPRRLFGVNYERYARLHPLYNVIARHAKHTEQKWRAKGANIGLLSAALLHFTRETRPWQGAPHVNNVTRAAEWARGCGAVICNGLVEKRRALNNRSDAAARGYMPPPSIGIHSAWEPHCRLVRNATTTLERNHSARVHGNRSGHAHNRFHGNHNPTHNHGMLLQGSRGPGGLLGLAEPESY